VVNVTVGDEHRLSVGRLQAQMADGLKDKSSVGGIATVNEHKASPIADHDPVGGWSFDEKDTWCLLGNVG
jgi:hypothetical protein